MILATVVGTVVCGQRADGFDSPTYLLVEKCDQHGEGKKSFMVAFDLVGANRDEMVMLSQGSASRQTKRTFDMPVDAVIVGIIDTMDQQGKVVYQK